MGKIHVIQWNDMQTEAAGIATFVKAHMDAGDVEPGNVLVLAPRREFGYLVRDQLNQLNIPAHSFFSEQLLDGNPKKIDESRAQQAMALLALLANSEDRVAMRCWCGFGNSSLADAAWARLQAHCEISGDSPWQAFEKLTNNTLQLPYTGYIVNRFQALQALMVGLDGVTGQLLVDAVFPPNEPWATPFLVIASGLEEDDFGPPKLSSVIRRSVSQPDMPTDVDYVRVMSLHKSKGLTADLVVVCGCLQGLIPRIDTNTTLQEQERSMEEQRRLFYVAITRTRKMLVLSSVTGLPVASAFKMRARTTQTVGGMAKTVASQFIHELGPQCPASVTGQDFLVNAVV